MTQLRSLLRLGCILALIACSGVRPARAQTAAADPAAQAAEFPLVPRLTELLRRAANGHSPTPEEIAAASTLPPSPADALREALPLLLKALANSDPAVRTYALSTLAALQSPPEATPTPADPASPPLVSSIYKSETAKLLAPAIPQIAVHLTDEGQSDRLLTATILGGFTPSPPAAVYPPLLAFLKRDDAISPVGLAVVADLLQLGPLSQDTTTNIARYLHRSDQTADTRSNLVEVIASKPNQSQSLNKALLAFLDSDDPNLRARLILSLPQLDLSPDLFADTKARISTLIDNSQESLQVVTAARAIGTCWTSTRMATGCPTYEAPPPSLTSPNNVS